MHCRDAMHVFQLLLVAAVEAVGLSAAAQHPGQIFLPTTLKCPLPHIHAPHVCPPLPPPLTHTHLQRLLQCCPKLLCVCRQLLVVYDDALILVLLGGQQACNHTFGGGGWRGVLRGGKRVCMCVFGGGWPARHTPRGGGFLWWCTTWWRG